MAFEYGHEKFTSALFSMCLSTYSVQRRLANAFADHLIPVRAEVDLPTSAREKFEELVEEVTQVQDEERGSLIATIDEFDEWKCREIVDQLFVIKRALNEAYFTGRDVRD